MEVRDSLALFASCLWSPDDLIEVRCLPSKKSWWWKASDLPDHEPEMRDAESRGEHVYAGANPRRSRGDRDGDGVTLARTVFVDFDNCSIEEAGRRLRDANLPAPTLILFSGGGVHVYWRLDEPASDLADWTARQQGLIDALGSDGKVKDPPRIMRLPGFRNHKREADARIVGAWPEREYAIVEFRPAGRERAVHAASVPATSERRPDNLGRLTRDFLIFGAPEGERNQRAYMAGCELQGNGFAEPEAVEMVLVGARRCGLPDAEAVAAVRSAYSKPHGPSRAPMTEARFAKESGADAGPVPDHLRGGAPPRETPTGTPAPPREALHAAGDEIESRKRMGVSNVLVDKKFIKDPESGKSKPMEILHYRRIDDVSSSLLAATGGWPKCAGGLLFSVRESPPGFLPTASNVRYFGQPVDLWAWCSEVCDPYWTKQKCHDLDGHPRTPATKEEFHRHLRDCASQRFLSVSILPHEPKIPGTFYVPCELPTPAGKRLAEFLAMLNPDTEDDRWLMLACLLTMLWGGPHGGRPMFVFDSRHGRGSGKTATAEALAAVVGGAFRIEPDDDWETVKKRLMSDRAMAQRAVLIDNVKKKLGGPQIEGMVTASTIDGWRPYHGNFSRPNDLTWLVTQNAARGTQDVATRAVIIHVGAPKHGDSFVAKVAQFIESYRAELIADLLALLAGPPKGSVSPANRDRFQAWQDGPLSRCDGPDRLAGLIIARRGDLDSDSEEAEEVASAIRDYVAKRNPPCDRDGRRKISRDQMRELLKAANVVDDTMGKRGLYTWLLNMLGSTGPLACLEDGKPEGGQPRHWLWSEPHDIPV